MRSKNPQQQKGLLCFSERQNPVVPETGIEPVRPLFTKRRILSAPRILRTVREPAWILGYWLCIQRAKSVFCALLGRKSPADHRRDRPGPKANSHAVFGYSRYSKVPNNGPASMRGWVWLFQSLRSVFMKTSGLKLCAQWLAFCLSIGWSRDSLDALEKLWWAHHDENGNLTP